MTDELFEAVRALDIKRANELLDQGADPNIRDKNGNSCLIIAVEKKSKEMIDLLLDKGADIDDAGGKGWSPLTKTVLPFDEDMMLFLLERGARIDQDEKDRISAITLAWYVSYHTDMDEPLELLRNAAEIRRKYIERKIEEAHQKKLSNSHAAATTNQDITRSARPPSTVKKRPVP